MGLKERYCPNCGEKIKINEEKEFNFCSHCGFKIIAEHKQQSANDTQEQRDIEALLEEVEFYFQMSCQRKEAITKEKNPVYYLKAQDLLRESLNNCTNDYRIWWELSKPIDYEYLEEAKDYENNYVFNEEYFNKALDYAGIETKKQLIIEKEGYESKKEDMLKKFQTEFKALQEEEEKKRLEEAQRRLEEQRKIELEEQEANRIKEECRIAEEQKEKEKMERIRNANQNLWGELSKGNYESIDDAFFVLNANLTEMYVCLFKVIANILYLVIFEENKHTKTAIQLQTIMIKITDQGIITHYNNKPIKQRIPVQQGVIGVSIDTNGCSMVGGNKLSWDSSYTARLMAKSKKPMLNVNKIFA